MPLIAGHTNLSGGMRQRVSLAPNVGDEAKDSSFGRAVSRRLDAMTRSVLQEEILRIWEEERQTCVMITNDVDEAILVADRIVPLNPGPPKASVGSDRSPWRLIGRVVRAELNHKRDV